MRISDWSSDVCSSDLRAAAVEAHRHRAQLDAEDGADALEIVEHELEPVVVDAGLAIPGAGPFLRRVRKLVEAIDGGFDDFRHRDQSEEHTSELQSLMRISYAVFCLKKKTTKHTKESIKRIN